MSTTIRFEDDKLMIEFDEPSSESKISHAAKLLYHELKYTYGDSPRPADLFGNRVVVSFSDKSHIFTIDELLDIHKNI